MHDGWPPNYYNSGRPRRGILMRKWRLEFQPRWKQEDTWNCHRSSGFIEDFCALRRSVRQNTVKIYTASTFTDTEAPFINHQTRIVSIFRRPTELRYKIVRPAGEPPRGHLRPGQQRKKSSTFHSHSGKWWLESIRPLIPKILEMIRPMNAVRPNLFRSPRQQIMATLQTPSSLLPHGTLCASGSSLCTTFSRCVGIDVVVVFCIKLFWHWDWSS